MVGYYVTVKIKDRNSLNAIKNLKNPKYTTRFVINSNSPKCNS